MGHPHGPHNAHTEVCRGPREAKAVQHVPKRGGKPGNPQGQRQTSTFSIPRDNFGERKAKFNLGTSRTTQM
jgi:hypothetical protein